MHNGGIRVADELILLIKGLILHVAFCILHLTGQTPGGGTGDGEHLIGADEIVAAGEANQAAAFGAGSEQFFIV